jgi:hypothetical protein
MESINPPGILCSPFDELFEDELFERAKFIVEASDNKEE